jgi:hypothetical protein
MNHRVAQALALLSCSIGLTACGTQNQPSGESLRFLTTSLPPAYVAEQYSANVQLSSGTRPYTLKRAKGELPPGLNLSGYILSGTPTGKLDQPKTYTFTLEATDANLANKVQEFTLTLNPERPSSLEWVLPATSVQGEQRIPVMMKSPRRARSYRVSVPWPKSATLIGLEPGEGKPVLFHKQDGEVLLIHGALTEPLQTMKEVAAFYIVMKLPEPTKLEGRIGFEVRAGGRTVASQEITGPRPATPPTTPPGGTPAPPPAPGTPPASPSPTNPPAPPTSPPPAPPASPPPASPPPPPPPAGGG